ncbi:tetratricopeptide (TPR) repeat protein [Paraburkholderia sp. GAS448]|uniref:tetratricopeptide repeat protein n=1 Tax=Paraburkholderia sp. GAS448 TaxID=3035136 RepID=UPI003D24E361
MDDYIAKRPEDPKALYFRGISNLGCGFLEGAGEDFRAALVVAPENDPLNSLTRAGLAEVYRRGGEVSKAIEEVDRALQANPKIPSAQLTRLELLASYYLWPEIGLVAEQVLRLSPDPRAVRLIAEALYILGRFTEAAIFVERFQQGSPVHTVALAVRARARYYLNDCTGALTDADDALKQDPTDPDANLARAQSLAALERWDDATSAAETAYPFVRPSDAGRIELLQVLRRVHKAKHASQQPPEAPI